MISQPVAMGPSCHHTYPTPSILSEQDSTGGMSESSSQQKKVTRTTGPGHNDKSRCHKHTQLQGFSEEVPRKDFLCAPNTQVSDTKTGPQTSCGTADTALLQSSINENTMFCSTNTSLSLMQCGLALLEILNSSTHTEKIDKK